METKNEVISTPAEMIQLAVSKGADLDKLEKLLTLQERYEANQARKAYHKAMADFKANPPKIDKDQTVKFGTTQYNHASLFNVTEKISGELSKHGLSASWTTQQNGQILVTCKITHVLGHSEETTIAAPADASGSKNAIQAIGSTITYLQRYTLLSLAGLATCDQDDDGRAAGVEYVTEKQLHELRDHIIISKTDEGKLCAHLKIDTLEKLPQTRFQEVVSMLKAKSERLRKAAQGVK